MGERCEFEEKLIEANCTMDGRVICRNGGVCRLDKNTIPGCICPPTYQGESSFEKGQLTLPVYYRNPLTQIVCLRDVLQ